MRAWPVALLVAVGLAGCLEGAPSEPTESPAAPDPLLAPPEWQVGDWWRVRIQDPITQSTRDVTQVVAAVTEDHYVVGFPAEEWDDAALILHIPGYGAIERSTLGWEVHDEAFVPLRFPLVHDDTWETPFEGLDMHAEVTDAHLGFAKVSFTGPGLTFTLTYDSTLKAVSSFESPDYASFTTIDHGNGYVGDVLAPLGADLVFLHGRIAGALDISVRPAPPIETVTVPAGYDALTFALLLGTLIPPDGPQGVYREAVTDPYGETYEALVTPADGPGLHAAIHRVAEPAGEWTFQHAAVGPGVAAVEGIAYRTETYTLLGDPRDTA